MDFSKVQTLSARHSSIDLSIWLAQAELYDCHALIVTGPDWQTAQGLRKVLAANPLSVWSAADLLAKSEDFGSEWLTSKSPMQAWQNLYSTPLNQMAFADWRQSFYQLGFRSFLRMGFELPAQKAFECYLLSYKVWPDRRHVNDVTAWLLKVWPELKTCLTQAISPLTIRESACLVAAFEGLTAKEIAVRMVCTERTVNYHMANIMEKLEVSNKQAAIQRACWMGLL